MRNEFTDSPDFFAAMLQLNQSSYTISMSSSADSAVSFWPDFSMSIRQITNSKGETYPSDFGVGLPPLSSQDDY
ncbi:MAG TPA: hypothetical protein V6C89_03395 [Drouetiella sp.]|jgi:hypothetical protein